MMIIKLSDLRADTRWCSKQVDLFENLFGEQAEVTTENVVRAWKTGIDIDYYVTQVVNRNNRYFKQLVNFGRGLSKDETEVILMSGISFIRRFRLALGENGMKPYLPKVQKYAEIVVKCLENEKNVGP